MILRGGEKKNDGEREEDSYDEYDDDEEELAEVDEASSSHDQRRDLQLDPKDRLPPRRPGKIPAPYIPRKKKKKNVFTQLAQTSMSVSQKAAMTTLKTSGKAAYYLMRPKAIKKSEIWGVWRLDQQIGMKQSTANIELTKKGYVIIRSGDEIIWKAPFQFISPTWPQSCRVEFEARAFQPSPKSKPWLLFYKGYFERKVADSSVIKIVGKVYEIERPKSMFGRKDLPVRYNKIGSFVGRRRVVLLDDEDDIDEDDSDVDEDDLSDGENHPRYDDDDGGYDTDEDEF